jgi:4-diphosphocytidyl-2-C-methyl-D-erythritol kinase
MTRRVVIEARAKLNLGLAVGPRRRDGYHELATCFQSISLADTLIATRTRRGFSLSVKFPRGSRASKAVPRGTDNLVLRAARLLFETDGLEGGAAFTLIKRIPARAGLGGGSADAAAAILALERLYGLRPDRAARHELAARLGADVPFAIRGGTALGFGRGEKLLPVLLARPFRAVIAVPAWGVSTARAFAQIDRKKFGLTVWNAKLRFARRLAFGPIKPEQALGLGNTFELALGSRTADFHSLCARLGAAGLSRPTMTGSGSAVFGILASGFPVARFARRFKGAEELFVVRSMRTGWHRAISD